MKTTSYNYKISLRPLDYFFFGGEQTFGSGARANYFAKSNLFPQQTTILGVLRHLGIKNKLDIGISFNHKNTNPNYGFIKNISPVFLKHKHSGNSNAAYYLPGPLGHTETGLPYKITTMEGGKKMTPEGFEPGYMAHGFNPKFGTSQKLFPRFKEKDNDQSYADSSHVLHKNSIIGIKKTINDGSKSAANAQKDQQDGFFKQEVVRMSENWSFIVLAELDEEAKIPAEIILPIGGQKMLWSISLEKVKEGDNKKELSNFFSPAVFKHTYPENLSCLMLTSDAFLKADFYKDIKFAITETQDFRYIHTPKTVTNFARMKTYADWGVAPGGTTTAPPTSDLYKSQKYNLIKRGSLLYGDIHQLKSMLDKEPWQTIGYNHYFEIEKN